MKLLDRRTLLTLGPVALAGCARAGAYFGTPGVNRSATTFACQAMPARRTR